MKRVKSEIASEFIDYLGEVYDACGYIHDMGGCDKCPMKNNCLDETTVSEFANFCTKDSVKEMLDFADDVENYIHEKETEAWEAANRWAGIDPSWANLPRVGRI